MTEPVLHTFEDGTELVLRQITMSEAVELDSMIWQKERTSIIQMLDDANATSEDRIGILRDHYERRGLATEMTRQLFRVPHARTVLDRVSEKTESHKLDRLSPNLVTELALRCVGYELPREEAKDDSVGK